MLYYPSCAMSRGENKWWVYQGSKPVALLLLAAFCVGGLSTEGSTLLGTRALDAQGLGTPPVGRYVDVACDSLERAGRFNNGQHGYLCRLGSRLLPIVGSKSDDEDLPSHLVGRLLEFRNQDHYGRSDTGDFIWSDDVLENPAVVNAYLEVKTLWQGRVMSVLAMLVGVAAIALSLRWRIGPWGRWWGRWQGRLRVA